MVLSDCAVRQADFRGWDACYLENGYIRLVGVPDIGGRIMAYDLGPYPFFFIDPEFVGKLFSPEENQGDGSLAAWKNYGGDKTWPSPQGWDTDEQWPGPPDPVLDSGRYTLDEISSDGMQAVLRMTSPPDQRTGIQLTRQLTLHKGSSRATLDITFHNIKDKPIRWSIWDVVQLRAERQLPDGKLAHESSCVVTTPLNPNSRFPKGFNVMFGEESNPQWQAIPEIGLFKADYLWEIGKVGIDSPAGWIAFSNSAEGYAFIERFEYEPDGDYPDGGVTVECWTTGAGEVGNLNYADSDIYLMETEVLSPMRDINPGDSASFSIEWGVCRCPGPIVEVSEAGCGTAPLRVTAINDEFVQLSGQFGVFDVGELSLVWLDGGGEPIARQPLGHVDPLATILLDRVAKRPAGAKRIELRVTANADGIARQLANMAV